MAGGARRDVRLRFPAGVTLRGIGRGELDESASTTTCGCFRWDGDTCILVALGGQDEVY